MDRVRACVREVEPLMADYMAGRTDAVAERVGLIFQLENEADTVKNELRDHLPKSIFLPIARHDLLDVVHGQDSIADTAQDIAELCRLRHLPCPEPMRGPLVEYVRASVHACEQSFRVLEELDELVETSFAGPEAGKVHEMIDEINRREHTTDDLRMQVIAVLFAHEDGLKPIEEVLWLKMIDLIDDLANYAKKSGNRLRLLIAEK